MYDKNRLIVWLKYIESYPNYDGCCNCWKCQEIRDSFVGWLNKQTKP